VEQVDETPIAASALVQLLRGSVGRSIDDGLLLESAAYSALQAGPEFRAWRESRPRKHREEPDGPPVLVGRDGARLTVTLNRPHVRNALNSAMRDALADAFRLVELDDSIESVELRGAGLDYSSGGDLDEFGSFPDPATAHLVRLTASVGRAIARVAERVHVTLHGACMGSGIELPAFAGRLTAAGTARFGLPELGLGLIPGAGGTWSLPQRIGRHRTALLALTCRPIDAVTAHAWGLVTEVSDRLSSD
jgi:enoyl-CoA hydratase/carnithine racemase